MDIGTGTTITFATGFFAEILDITGPGLSRESIQTSHMGTTTAHTFLPGDLYDGGELTVELGLDVGQTPPISSVAESITITGPGGDTIAFDGFMTGFEPRIPLEDRMTATATIKVTGTVTFTQSS